MRLYKIIIFSLFISSLVSCAITIKDTRIFPRHYGVNPEFKPYMDDWFYYAKLYNIKFNKFIAIGFDDIDRGDVVGLTHYGLGFTEIDIDRSYWHRATSIQKTILLFHEAGHAYCNRGHGYGKDGKYEEKPGSEGRFKDSCALSIMYPYVIDSDCFYRHYQEYIDEMFQNCDPI